MYTQYLKPALRKIFTNRLYSLISIASLAAGMTTCILIFGFMRFELGFDRMHPGSERIYRLNWGDASTGTRFATFFNPVAPILAEAMPEIEVFTRLGFREHVVAIGENRQRVNLTLVDDDFFALFSYPALAGNPDTSIRDYGAAILTEAAASRLFGRTNVVGETLSVDGAYDFRVGAVVADNPAQSHMGSNIFLNIENLPELWNEPRFWTGSDAVGSDRLYSYVRLAPGIDGLEFESEIENYITQNLAPAGYQLDVFLQPLANIHFNPDLQNELPMVDDMLGTVKPLRKDTDLLLFGSIAVLTLAIAALNFMNMQAVRFTRQIREVGVRRVVGSSYSGLTLHFLTESALIALFALLIAVPFCELLSPWFYSLLGVPYAEAEILSTPMVLGLALAAMLLGMLVALYPALSTAMLKPTSALRGEFSSGKSAAAFRSILIVLQFTISIGLIVGSFTVKNQIDYALSKELGFDPRNVVRIELPNGTSAANYELMKNELLGLPGVSYVTAGTGVPTRSLSDGVGYVPESGDIEDAIGTRTVSVTEDYFATLGMNLVAGRAFSTDFADRKPPLSADNPMATGGMILNETAARLAGWNNPEDAIGKHLYQAVQQNGTPWINDYTVVGVAADAHFGSVRRVVEPVSFTMPQNFFPNVMMVRLSDGNSSTTLNAIDALWAVRVPDQPIRRSFLENDYLSLYAGEGRTFALFIALASLAVLIACSGLYGLASYITERRTKEIGVRKVMGGSVWSIVLLISNDFSRLVLLSNLIAWPLAYLAMERWLQNFAYRIDLTPLIFIGSGLIALCIAWVTVGGTAAKAASAKPVLALRYE